MANAGCESAQEPSTAQIVRLEGASYERGLAHGQQMCDRIRSLYTRLLDNSLLPYLNREQGNVGSVLTVYHTEPYQEGRFSYQMLLESGMNLYEHHMPEAYQQELQGVADGCDRVSFDEIIVLNTFVDTMLGFRAVTMFIQQIQTPFIASLGFVNGPTVDGADNDGDGETDEAGEAVFDPYETQPHAHAVEISKATRLEMIIKDRNLGDVRCMDLRNIDPVLEADDASVVQELLVDHACVIEPACVVAGCEELAFLPPECLRGLDVDCIRPRVYRGCFDPYCLQIMDPGCVDEASIRIQMDDRLFEAGDPAIEVERLPVEGEVRPRVIDPDNPFSKDCQGPLRVTFTPPGGFPAAAEVSLIIQVGDISPVFNPEPFHNRYMRDERVVITTAGYASATGEGARPLDVPNRGVDDGRSQPPSVAFAARGAATHDGAPLLGQHFALLDSNTVHEHTALFVHHPDDGAPFAYLGWAGLIWGFSGMNDRGLSYATTYSDSLDNPLVGGVINKIIEPASLAKLATAETGTELETLAEVVGDLRLLATGLPIGLMGRELLARHETSAEAVAFLNTQRATFGWNLLLADAAGELALVELDGASGAEPWEGEGPPPLEDRDGFMFYDLDFDDPRNLDAHGRPWASVGEDTLLMGSHYRKNTDDVILRPFMDPFDPESQRFWTRFYFRSMRAFHVLADQIEGSLGALDVPWAVKTLSRPDLVDERESMNAAVFEPAARRIHWASGQVPATDGPFEVFDFPGAAAAGGAP